MAAIPYYGAYARFTTPNKKEGSALMGADNLVGDRYEVEFRVENGDQVPWLRNRFGKAIGYVIGAGAEQLVLCNARGWKVNVVLASVFYSESPDPGVFWGEVVIICYSTANEAACDTFVQGISNLLAEGVRPTVDVGEAGFEQILATGGTWLPETREEKFRLEKGQAIIKENRSFNEKVVELARKRNPGCMAVGILFTGGLIVLVLWLIKSLLGF